MTRRGASSTPDVTVLAARLVMMTAVGVVKAVRRMPSLILLVVPVILVAAGEDSAADPLRGAAVTIVTVAAAGLSAAGATADGSSAWRNKRQCSGCRRCARSTSRLTTR